MSVVRRIGILGATAETLAAISRRYLLSLDVREMEAIRDHFARLGRNPTDCELETLAQTWSEHCVHKTFRAEIAFSEERDGRELERTVVLLREIAGATKRLRKRWCISVFEDNAGIIDFAGGYGVAFKVETHNHPSALEPYGGAGTGIGGVIRDVLGVGLGGRPILNTDVFCFGMPETPYASLPEGVLHPRRIFKGVVSGVRDYGNRMGIPTANGAILFDPGYLYNCLVFCGTLGLIPKDRCFKKVQDGDQIVVVGGRTGRDGIHGATFSSASLEKDIPTSVVQIGNPIVEKKVLDVLMTARDRNLYHAITDCGAGGLSSAVGEMGRELGARVFLERVPLKYRDLSPWEIWLSESQERMVLAVPSGTLKELLDLFAGEDVEATVIGRFLKTGRLRLTFRGETVGDIDMGFLHDGIPPMRLKATHRPRAFAAPALPRSRAWGKDLLAVLALPTVASKELVIRQYDHEVQGLTVMKPLVGPGGNGPGDAVVLKPLYDRWEGVAVSCGINPLYGKDDPYRMAGCCIEEAIRNVVCVGADPDRIAVLDNFCWGNTRDPEELGSLVRCVEGCRDFALAYGTPFISGKDSLNNFFRKEDGTLISIPGTLLISAVGVVPDVRRIVSSDLKRPGNPIYLWGMTQDELGGSQYLAMLGATGGAVPLPVPGKAREAMMRIHRCIRRGVIVACHDCSDGGLAVAIGEMCIGGAVGAAVDIARACPGRPALETAAALFSESQGRFLLEVDRRRQEDFGRLAAGQPVFRVGVVLKEPCLTVTRGGQAVLKVRVRDLEAAWKGTLQW